MSQDFSQKIQKIREQANIVDIIGQYLKLTKKANNFWAVCPFHQDSNPSLSVSQDKQIYKCFSCGEQGNVFIFLQKYKKIDFLTAVKEVAEVAKIDLEQLDLNLNESQKIKLHPFKILNNLALNFYQYQITTTTAKDAFNYLKERQISEKNINDFNLGFAPNRNQLLEYLQLQGYQNDEIIAAGLAKISDQDQIKDMFFNRIIFPIIDLDGECLGFSARSFLKEQKEKASGFKYINTPETAIFKKGKILYNLYNAKNSLNINNKSIYLVEGYMDVISLSSQNINNCVALMGTNLTKDHINTLKQFTNDIIIFLDGDHAGRQAAIKIATSLLSNNFNVKIIDNQTNQDPDELIKNDHEKFSKIIKTTLHPFDFAINFYQTKYDFEKDSYQLKEFLIQLQSLWVAIKDRIIKDFYFEKLKDLTKLSDEALSSVLKLESEVVEVYEPIMVEPKPPIKALKQGKQNNLPKISLKEKLLELQKQLFFLLLLDYQVYLFLEKEKFIFDDKRLMNLYFLVAEKYQNGKIKKIDLLEFSDLLKDNDIFDFFDQMIKKYENLAKNYQINQIILKDYTKNIENCRINLKISVLNQEINNSKNLEMQLELLKQMSILKNKLHK